MKNKKLVLGILALTIVGIIFISGCAEKECKTNDDCLAKNCFTVECKDNNCIYSLISNCCGNDKCEPGETYENCFDDCPNCDDKNDCTSDEYDHHEQKCVNTIIPNVICCGNKICETGETYSNCARDCPNCDDGNECTKDSYDYYEQKCINEPIIPCCGNDICDKGVEEYSNCLADCPNCDDNNKLTTDSFNYVTQKCENIVIPYFIDDFEEGAWSPDAPDFMTWDTEQVHSGSRSLKTTLNNVPLAWYFWTSDLIPVKANQKYYLREWIKTENADQGAHLDVHYFDASYEDTGNGGSAGLLSGTNDWTFRESTFVTPSGTEYIQILNAFYGTNGTAWFDDITLIEETD